MNHGRLVTHTAASQLTSAGLIQIRTPQIDELSSALTGAGASVRRQQRPQSRSAGSLSRRSDRSRLPWVSFCMNSLPSANTLEDAFLELTNIEGEGS
jgi:hypothetical protein